MVKKRTGKKGSPKKKIFVFSRTRIITIASIIILGVILYFYLIRPPGKPPIPLYEEIHSESDVLADNLIRVDRMIFKCLYHGDVKDKDIVFSEVITRHKGEHDWNFTEILVRMPDSDSISNLSGIISREIYKLKPNVSLKKEILSQNQTVYHVYIRDLYTHRIKLTVDFEQKKDLTFLPEVAIIIDDIGYDPDLAASFMDCDLPIVLSILPLAPHSAAIAEQAKRKGFELLLHIPMEPKDYPRVNPGEGALLVEMDEEIIRKLVKKYAKMIPGIKGVNNHMGSCFTEKKDKMKYVLEEVKSLDLFFVDSRTTKNTVAYELAKSMEISAAEKSLFLDNDISHEAIKFQMDRLLSIARRSGSAVGIGHPHVETLKVLREYADLLKKEYRVVPVSVLTN